MPQFPRLRFWGGHPAEIFPSKFLTAAMKVWTRLDSYEKDTSRPLILALGNFDGVHVGHQQILQAVVNRARKQGGSAAVLTFAEHPQRVLHHSPEPGLLSSPQHRLLLFQEMGLDLCFLLPFTIEFSKTRAEDFVEEWLVKRLSVKEVHLGYNAHFGSDRLGDGALMRRLAARWGFGFFEADPIQVEGEYVSSTLIRRAVQEGNLEKARRLLGRPFTLFASVVRGEGRGKTLGFPTANLNPHSEIFPPRGVYPVEIRSSPFHLRPIIESHAYEYEHAQSEGWQPGILNYGTRPTFDSAARDATAEVFLFNFRGDLYGKTVEVLFHSKLRDERPFQSSEELVQAIQRDVASAEEYFRTRPFTK